jgi:ERO1-like protein alpha
MVYDIAKATRNKDEWCEHDEMTKSNKNEFIFVNLNENRESFTDYNGTLVWNVIYQENCMMDRFDKIEFELFETCSEETLLYQLISGVHASVNIHINNHYSEFNLNGTARNHTRYYHSIGKYKERL